MATRVALIAGATGAIGSAIVRELSNRPDWKVYGISRNAPQSPITDVDYIQLDLNNSPQCVQALTPLTDVTHVYYSGRATHAEQVLENPEDNLRLLTNLLNAIESTATLQHMHLVQGGKYYGVHVGQFPTPAREEQARSPVPNFNYDQQDFLQSRSANASWTWTASRPNTLIHFSPDNSRNLVSSLAAYASICKSLGAALDFPGPQGAYNSITQVTSLDLLARGIAWMSTTDACANQGFNITNTDVFRWSVLWPKLAAAFDIPLGTVRPLQLKEIMADRQDLWTTISNTHHLKQTDLQKVANWDYLDATLIRDWDEIFCHNKVRGLGFHDWDNSEEKILQLLALYRDARIIPA